jgi:hypothetical protein
MSKTDRNKNSLRLPTLQTAGRSAIGDSQTLTSNRGAVAYMLPPQIAGLIFSDPETQQKVRGDLQVVCDQLKIEPESLTLKTQENFKEEAVPERVQIVRFHHYNQKRMKHLEIIDQFFK